MKKLKKKENNLKKTVVGFSCTPVTSAECMGYPMCIQSYGMGVGLTADLYQRNIARNI